jgi:dTDP-4-dehydrorhamnose 3,5-epimerase
MFDVIVDLRPDSITCMQWLGVELSAENHRMLYVPEGCAQGYITLIDNTEMCYGTSQFYSPGAAFGVRFDDPVFNIQLPLVPTVISQQDRNWPLMER